MKHKNTKSGWTTDDEIDYINNIGSYTGAKSKIPLLRGYIDSAKNRVDWHGVDSDAAIRQATGLLNALGRFGG